MLLPTHRPRLQAHRGGKVSHASITIYQNVPRFSATLEWLSATLECLAFSSSLSSSFLTTARHHSDRRKRARCLPYRQVGRPRVWPVSPRTRDQACQARHFIPLASMDDAQGPDVHAQIESWCCGGPTGMCGPHRPPLPSTHACTLSLTSPGGCHS